MNSIERLQQMLRERFPAASSTIDAPKRETGTWWLDVSLRDSKLHIAWSPKRGFGVSSDDADAFGEGHDEGYPDVDSAWRRVRTLLLSGGRTASPFSGALRKLREERNVSQAALAERLAIQQAAVSKIERRGDPLLSSVRAFAAALGGELEMRVVFPDGVRVLNPDALIATDVGEPPAPKVQKRG